MLKVIAYQNPGLLAAVREQLTSQSVDTSVLRRIYQYTHIIHNSYDPQYNLLVYLACGLKLYSPESLLADCKVRMGVCAALASMAGITRRDASYYIRRYARHYYEKRKGFAELVDGIVERLG